MTPNSKPSARSLGNHRAHRAAFRCVLFLTLGLLFWPVQAVLLVSTADPDFNTTPPTGDLAGSGWQYQGLWGNYLGTPIAPFAFITAKHVRGSVGDAFIFNQVTYTTTAYADCPTSDLRIWWVNTPFPIYAPLYSGSTEVGKPLVVFGRGTQRGTGVYVNGVLKGWRWGSADQRLRWGENVVSSITEGGPTEGQLLRAQFNFAVGGNEAHLSVGDSGGGVFIHDGGVWKLAGINYAVDSKWSLTGGADEGFDAAIFDAGGLYVGQPGNWQYIPDLPTDIPSSFYATRISANLNWIYATVPEPVPATLLAALPLVSWAALRRLLPKRQ